jgi:predicted flap endonuclease-1-like 5' DNA nuclease
MLAIAGEIVVVVLAAAAGAAAREEATAGTLSLADDLYARTQRLHAVEARLARAQEQLGGRTAALAATTERIQRIENEAEVARREFAALEHERARLASRVTELVVRVAEIERVEGAQDAREQVSLRARIAALEPLERSPSGGADPRLEAAPRLRRIRDRVGLAGDPAPRAARPAAGRAPNGSPRDDLKRIPGIGRATERILHSVGVFTFRQIANWRREDLEAITAKLGDSPGRLKRDDWIDGARREHLKKYGEAP